eukprot:UN28639
MVQGDGINIFSLDNMNGKYAVARGCLLMTVTFMEKLDLENFPFDVQYLKSTFIIRNDVCSFEEKWKPFFVDCSADIVSKYVAFTEFQLVHKEKTAEIWFREGWYRE